VAFALEYAPRARIMSIEIGLYTAPLTAPPMDQWTSISFLCAEDDSDEVSYSHDRLQQFTVQLLDYQCSWVVYQWVEWLILGWHVAILLGTPTAFKNPVRRYRCKVGNRTRPCPSCLHSHRTLSSHVSDTLYHFISI
jgi:hypothetical protein